MPLTTNKIKAAVKVFQETYHPDCEYGISDEDAWTGVVNVLESLGLIDNALHYKILAARLARRRQYKREALQRSNLERMRDKYGVGSLSTKQWYQEQTSVLNTFFYNSLYKKGM